MIYLVSNNKKDQAALIRVDQPSQYFRTIAGKHENDYLVENRLNTFKDYCFTPIAASGSHPLVGDYIDSIGDVVFDDELERKRKLKMSKAKASNVKKAKSLAWLASKEKAVQLLMAGVSVKAVCNRCQMSDTTARKLKRLALSSKGSD